MGRHRAVDATSTYGHIYTYQSRHPPSRDVYVVTVDDVDVAWR